MNLTKEQPPAKYTLEMTQAELRALYGELLNYCAGHPNSCGWSELKRLRIIIQEHA